MMICPESYINGYKNMKYSDSIKIRDELILSHPSPEVIYQMNLQYFGKLCGLIAEKYKQAL